MAASHPETPAAPAIGAAGTSTGRRERVTSRAGRDLVAAIGVGVGMGAVIIASLLVDAHWFIGVLAVSAAAATWELAAALRRGADIRVPLPVLLVGGQAMVWLGWPFGLAGVAVSFAFTALAVLLWRMRAGSAHFVRDVTAGLFAATYVPLFCAFATLMTVEPDGRGRVLTFLVCVVASDVGGYAAGVLAGRHPMAPTISPKKSWEGFGGSLAAGMLAGALAVLFVLHGPWWVGVLTGALLVVCATLGDLIESLIKRDLGIKDMGHLLPGHGGLLDRMDSMLPSALVAWAVLGLLLPT